MAGALEPFPHYPWWGSVLNELQDRFLCKVGETETKYLWRASLTVGDWIPLSDDVASGFWGPRVLLSDRPPGNQLITSQVTNWAGGVHPKEQGEPVALWVKGLSELAEGVQKTTCIQAMNERGRYGVLITAPVDREPLSLLLKGLLDTLKTNVHAFRERIQGPIECNWQALRIHSHTTSQSQTSS